MNRGSPRHSPTKSSIFGTRGEKPHQMELFASPPLDSFRLEAYHSRVVAQFCNKHSAAVVCGGPRMTFQIGDKVVYPNQGVGTIENISTRNFGCAFEKFYLLRFGCNSMTVLIPFSNAANIGLRRVTKDREISRILSYLSNGICQINPDWKVRFKENTDKMQSGDLLRAAEVFKSLLQLHVDKPLSFREKRCW